MKSIDDLPIELYSSIFKNLSIQDLFNCRLVNKKFKYATYENASKLVINDLGKYDNDYYWYNNSELINDDDIISLGCFRKIRSFSIFDLDKNLKYLKFSWNVNDYKRPKFRIKLKLNLNNFINLECLIFNSNGIESKININLKNLKYLQISCCIRPIYFELNTPKLEQIKFQEIRYICFKSNPESIKHVITSKYEYQLKIFNNLEILEMTNAVRLNEDLLSIFNNLKQLKIGINFKASFNELIEEHLIDIFNSQIELNRCIDMFFNGVKITNIKKLKEFKSYQSIEEYQIKNYNLLDSNLSNVHLNYSDLNNLIDIKNDLPYSFFNKFQTISSVQVCKYGENDKLIDSNHFSWFLSNLKHLKELSIIEIALDQKFFDNLPNTIRKLYIKVYKIQPLYLNINFDFILKLTKLDEFRLNNLNIDLFDLATKSYANLKHLETFRFCFNDQRIEIERERKYFYFRYLKYKYETISDNVIGRTSEAIEYNKLDYDQFVEKCNKLEFINSSN